MPSSTRSFRQITPTPSVRSIRRIAFARKKSDPRRGTLLVQSSGGPTYYYAEIARHEFRRLRRLAIERVLCGSDVWRVARDAPHAMQAAPIVRPVRRP